MARIIVISDRPIGCQAEILEDDETGGTYALTSCGELITDRGRFEDTVQAAVVHVDKH